MLYAPAESELEKMLLSDPAWAAEPESSPDSPKPSKPKPTPKVEPKPEAEPSSEEE